MDLVAVWTECRVYVVLGKWKLCGCLTWYGETTYVFKLGEMDHCICD